MSTQPIYAGRPAGQLKTNRGWLKTILLSVITFGIYGIVWASGISTDINLIASRYDGKKTMHFCLLLFVITPITCGIGTFIWCHRLSARIGREICRRGIAYRFGAGDYWGWNILGSIIGIGPIIYLHKLCKAMNLLCDDYNARG